MTFAATNQQTRSVSLPPLENRATRYNNNLSHKRVLKGQGYRRAATDRKIAGISA
jgi:hypothetical protein